MIGSLFVKQFVFLDFLQVVSSFIYRYVLGYLVCILVDVRLNRFVPEQSISLLATPAHMP